MRDRPDKPHYFYKYYGSQTDLLNEIESDFLAQLDESLALIPEQEGAVASVLANLYEQRTTFCTLVRAIPSHEFATHLFSLPGINGLFKTSPSPAAARNRRRSIRASSSFRAPSPSSVAG